MSCRASIRRRRLLTLSRSSTLVSGSNLNPGIGFKGRRRNDEEIILYVNSADRDPTEIISKFKVYVPDAPVFPINASVRVQAFSACIPNSGSFLRNEEVKLTFANDLFDLINGKLPPNQPPSHFLNGDYDPSETLDAKHMCFERSITTNYLYFDKHTNKMINNSNDTWIMIETSSDLGKKVYGFPTEAERPKLQFFVRSFIETLLSSSIDQAFRDRIELAKKKLIELSKSDRNVFILAPVTDPTYQPITPSQNLPAHINYGKFTYEYNLSNNQTGTVVLDVPACAFPNPIQMIPKCYYIRLMELFRNVKESVEYDPYKVENTAHSTIIAMVPANAGYMNVNTWDNPNNYSVEFDNIQDIRSFELILCDENGCMVVPEFDWSVGLRFFWTPEDNHVR